jgi:hypothetical protein
LVSVAAAPTSHQSLADRCATRGDHSRRAAFLLVRDAGIRFSRSPTTASRHGVGGVAIVLSHANPIRDRAYGRMARDRKLVSAMR